MKTKYIPLKPALLQSHINPFIDIEIFINENPEITHMTISAIDGKNLDKLLLKIYLSAVYVSFL